VVRVLSCDGSHGYLRTLFHISLFQSDFLVELSSVCTSEIYTSENIYNTRQISFDKVNGKHPDM
jgi:hypothetical protein